VGQEDDGEVDIVDLSTIPKELFTTLCLATGQTGRAAARLGVRFFLPELFRLRYANMGALDPEVFTGQLDALKSFEESAWCGYWDRFASESLAEAEKLVAGERREEARDRFIRAVTYYTVSAFPGTSPLRIAAYHKAADLFEEAVPMFDDRMEKVTLEIEGERVVGYARFPEGEGRCPLVIVTNGLEGTIQEIALPLLEYRDAEMGVFLMEMPGTYGYAQPMSGASEAIYSGVIEHFAGHPRVDPERVAMVGVSFGGYWSARMAASSPRLCCAVACGAPLHYAFGVANSLGTPQIIVDVLKKVTGAGSIGEMGSRLGELSFVKNDLFKDIDIPLLVINGDNDTLLGTRDSMVLAMKVPKALLKIYENDDHCAMGHYREWLDLTFEWLSTQFNR
jgi:esterase FrsA